MPEPASSTAAVWFYGSTEPDPYFHQTTAFERGLQLLVRDSMVSAHKIHTIRHRYQSHPGKNNNLPTKVGYMRVRQSALSKVESDLSGNDHFDLNLAISDVMSMFSILKRELELERQRQWRLPTANISSNTIAGAVANAARRVV